MKFYSLKNILTKNARYNLIFGERSNGKTYSVQEYALKRFWSDGEQLAVIRRWREDFRGKRGGQYFDNMSCNGKGQNVVSKITNGLYDRIVYSCSKWYLAYFDEQTQKNILHEKPFAFAFALTEMEHDKGNSYLGIKSILFDEFMTRSAYLPDEFVIFMNTISSIIRHRNDVKIFMCANTVSKFCPYFNEMGLNHVKQMQKGDIDVYTYGKSGLIVAVEYSDSPNTFKPSDVYFAFDNPKLQMITGGQWELDFYPHLSIKYDKKDILFSYFIQFEDHILQADIIITGKERFTYIHQKTTDIKHPEKDILFTPLPDEHKNHYSSLNKPVDKISKRIIYFFAANKVFYQSNDIGELVNQFIQNGQKVALR